MTAAACPHVRVDLLRGSDSDGRPAPEEIEWRGPMVQDSAMPLLDADSIVATVREPLLVLDGTLRVRRANRSFYQTFRLQPEETEGRLLYELGNNEWDIARLRTLLEEILPRNTSCADFEVDHTFPSS